jgi:purine-binding chemotaxis protein CheW
MHQLITFDIGDQCLGVDIMAVREIRAWAVATPLPNAPAYMKGVVNLRGVVLPVFDLRHRLGWGVTDPTGRHVIIVVQTGEQLCGLIVDGVNDIVRIEDEEMQPVPDTGGRASPFLTGLANHGDRLVLMLSLDALADEIAVEDAEAA